MPVLLSKLFQRPLRNFIILNGFIAGLICISRFIRFETQLFNDTSKFFLIGPIILLFFNGFFFKHIIVKILNALLYAVPFLFSLIVPLFAILIIGNGIFTSPVVRLYSIPLAHSFVNIYRADYGPTEPFIITVRQEKAIFPGILLYKELYKIKHADDIYYEMKDRKTLALKEIEYDFTSGEEKKAITNRFHEYKLKDHIYY